MNLKQFFWIRSCLGFIGITISVVGTQHKVGSVGTRLDTYASKFEKFNIGRFFIQPHATSNKKSIHEEVVCVDRVPSKVFK